MVESRRGVYLSICFRVGCSSWIREKGWEGAGNTQRARIHEFDESLYANLSARLATELGDAFWPHFQDHAAEKLLAVLNLEGALSREHLGTEFWERLNIMFQASLCCGLLERFANPYRELKGQLLEALEKAHGDGADDGWDCSLHTLMLARSLSIRVQLPAGPQSVVFGEVLLPHPLEICFELMLPVQNRLTYDLDQEPAELDDFDC